MKKSALQFVIALLVMSVSLAARSADWTEAQLGDFRIISNSRRERTVQVIRAIELHRIAFSKLFDVQQLRPGMPVTVFVLKKAEFDRFVPDSSKVGGMYFDSEFHPVIALNQDTLSNAQEVIYHELTHLLLHRFQSPAILPAWFGRSDGNGDIPN